MKMTISAVERLGGRRPESAAGVPGSGAAGEVFELEVSVMASGNQAFLALRSTAVKKRRQSFILESAAYRMDRQDPNRAEESPGITPRDRFESRGGPPTPSRRRRDLSYSL